MTKTTAVAAVLDGWTASAVDLYAQIERALFGIRGLRTQGVTKPSLAVGIFLEDKEAARATGDGDGLAVQTTVPKQFRESVVTVEGLTPEVLGALKRSGGAHAATMPVRTAEDAAAVVAVIRAKIDFLQR